MSSQPSSEAHDDTEDESQSCTTTPSWCASAGNRYRLCLTPTDAVPRESCRRSSGRATAPSTRHRRPGVPRYEPGLVTSLVDRAASTRQPTVTSTTATCSGGVTVAPLLRLLCCSARCFGDIYVLCTAFSVFPSFSYSLLGPSCFSLTVVPLDTVVRACNILLVR